MKTLYIFFVFFIFSFDVGLTQQQKIPSANNWNKTYDSIPFDSLKTGTFLDSSGTQIFSFYGNTFKSSGLFGFVATWDKDFFDFPIVPDTIKIDTKYIDGINVSESYIVIAMQDSNAYCYYYRKSLNLNTELLTISWDMTEMKKIMQSFGRFYLIFILLTKDSCYVGADVAVDNLRGVYNDSQKTIIYDTFGDPTGISDPSQVKVPSSFGLSQNYPNPFNLSTKIKFTVPTLEYVSLVVYNSLGQEVQTLVREEKSEGIYEVSFDASNLPSGTYFYRLQAGSFMKTKKMLLLK